MPGPLSGLAFGDPLVGGGGSVFLVHAVTRRVAERVVVIQMIAARRMPG
jgi:hypothetical protein